MKVVLRCLVVVAVILVFAGSLHAAGQETSVASVGTGVPGAVSGPSVVVAETSFNFGEILEGGEYVHDFMIKNAGTAPLEIKKVMPG